MESFWWSVREILVFDPLMNLRSSSWFVSRNIKFIIIIKKKGKIFIFLLCVCLNVCIYVSILRRISRVCDRNVGIPVGFSGRSFGCILHCRVVFDASWCFSFSRSKKKKKKKRRRRRRRRRRFFYSFLRLEENVGPTGQVRQAMWVFLFFFHGFGFRVFVCFPGKISLWEK